MPVDIQKQADMMKDTINANQSEWLTHSCKILKHKN